MNHSPDASPSSAQSLQNFGYATNGYCNTDAMVDSNNNDAHNFNLNHEDVNSLYDCHLKAGQVITGNANVNANRNVDYDRFEIEKPNNEMINLNINKYSNLGLSLTSQELIGEHYQILVNSNDATRAKSFEEIIYSIVEDIQSFKKETTRLEQSIKADKERNEEVLKHMIEEADHQLSQATEMINQERRREKEQYEKTIEKLKEHFNMEIFNLQESLDKMKQMEAKYEENKTKESLRVAEQNEEIKNLINENEFLKKTLSESESFVASLKNRIGLLEQEALKEDTMKKHSIDETSKEIQSLREELKNINEDYKILVDKNDALKEEVERLKSASIKSAESASLSVELPNNMNLSDEHNMVAMHHSGMFSANFQANIESDEELESGHSLNHQRNSPSAHLNVDKRKRNLSESHSSEIDDSQDNTNASERLSMAKKLLSEKLVSKSEKRSKIAKLVGLTNRTKPDITVIAPAEKLPEKVLRIAVVGDQAVGKTSFIMRYCKGQFLTTLSSTLGVDFHMKMLDIEGKSVALQLWDTCGQERFRSIAKSYFRRADGIVLMYDCNYERSFLNMREWIQIINDNNDKRIPIILVGNKTDLREASRATSTRPAVEYEDGLKLAKEFNTLFVETSAKEGINMEESFSDLIRSAINHQELECNPDAIQSQMDTIERIQSEELAKINNLSSEIQVLMRENQELKTLFAECQNNNTMMKIQLEALEKSEQSFRKAFEDSEKLNQQVTEEHLQTPKKGANETKALHNAYKKLNDINDLLRDEIENIKLKASKIAQKDSLAFNSEPNTTQKTS